MNDLMQHDCGIALIRFLKPFSYYVARYGSLRYCVERMYLLMHKQHNRGQDGAGIVSLKINLPPGRPYWHRNASSSSDALGELFRPIFAEKGLHTPPPTKENEPKNHTPEKYDELALDIPWLGELMLGHLRYGTYGGQEALCHPIVRFNNWRSRTLALAGNFNMTNNDELFDLLCSLGQHPLGRGDADMIMEKIGHFLDEEVQARYEEHNAVPNHQTLSKRIESSLSLARVLARACRDFDGGYVLAGLVGHGAAFVARDPHAIRPAYYYANDEVIVVTSEKAPIKSAFELSFDAIQAIPAGHALIIEPSGAYSLTPYLKKIPKPKQCVFERIYFSRASDPEIYTERKTLGHLLATRVLDALGGTLENTVFSYIPNTSEVAFLGMMEGIVKATGNQTFPRMERLISKDLKLRTFITEEQYRASLVSNIYDATYEIINKGLDRLVILDDSIVRGTTLQRSILTLLSQLEPAEIIIVSAAPQVRYPDCYGIDMSRLHEFVAFQAAISLLGEQNKDPLLERLAALCQEDLNNYNPEHPCDMPNHVKEIYAPFSEEELSTRIATIIRPKLFKPDLRVMYLPLSELRAACPNHHGDWYFSGNYPTFGGNRMVNRAFLYFTQGIKARAY